VFQREDADGRQSRRKDKGRQKRGAARARGQEDEHTPPRSSPRSPAAAAAAARARAKQNKKKSKRNEKMNKDPPSSNQKAASARKHKITTS
jgi:hypothetical protein